jgi:hypothetical protein
MIAALGEGGLKATEHGELARGRGGI